MANATEHSPKCDHPQPDRLTRDRQLVGFVARHGIVTMEHVMAALDVGRASAYRRVAHCIDRGLLERLELLRREPSLLRATRRGLRFAGSGMSLAVVSAATVDHSLRCASTAILLGREFGDARVMSERELILAERTCGRPIASAKVGELPDGRPRLHRPDLVVLPKGHPLVRFHQERTAPTSSAPDGNQARRTGEDDEAFAHPGFESQPLSGDSDGESGLQGPSSPRTQGGGRRERTDVRDRDPRTEDTGMRSVPEGLIVVEVELTPKSSQRLEAIIRGWRRASWVDEVHYHCEPGPTRRGVERAVRKLHAGDRIVISEAVSR